MISSTRSRTRLLSALVAVCLLAGALAAQPIASTTWFLPASEVGVGGGCVSTNYKLTGSFGCGVAADPAASTHFRLLGGFNACADAPVGGAPLLCGVSPPVGPLLGGTTHTLHGAGLALGSATNVNVGGAAATVISRSADRLVFKLPKQAMPGWRAVTVVNGGGSATLPQGVAVRPMLELPHAVEVRKPFRITYRGTQGDLLYFCAANGTMPWPIPIPPYHHGFELNLGALLALIGPLPVTASDGTFHLDFPGFFFVPPIYVQMLVLPTKTTGYQPGTFTNTLAL